MEESGWKNRARYCKKAIIAELRREHVSPHLNEGFVLLVLLNTAGIIIRIFIIALVGMAGGRCTD
jgi:hypothetical protein